MQLSYFHYFFKKTNDSRDNPPRVCFDLRPILKKFAEATKKGFPKSIEGKDGEKIFITDTGHSNVYMLVATRSQEIIKAINRQTLTCIQIEKRLKENETPGFASYFAVSEDVIGIASTLRGPKVSALLTFLNTLIQEKLSVKEWEVSLHAVSTSTTLAEARAMARISRTSVRVKPGNKFFRPLVEMLAKDKGRDNIDSICVTLSAKRNADISDAYEQMEDNTRGEGRDKLKIRAQAAIDEHLTDYLIEANGRFSEDVGTGKEDEIIAKIHATFAGNAKLNRLVEELRKGIIYDENADIPKLARYRNDASWADLLPLVKQ